MQKQLVIPTKSKRSRHTGESPYALFAANKIVENSKYGLEPMSEKISAPAALIYAMTTLSAADRTINDDELARIGSIVRELPPFRDYTDDWLADAAQECGKILKKPNGVGNVLDIIKKSLPSRLYETAYVLCAEVAASDLSVHTEEERFLSLLAATLSLDELTCAALRRAARARHQPA